MPAAMSQDYPCSVAQFFVVVPSSSPHGHLGTFSRRCSVVTGRKKNTNLKTDEKTSARREGSVRSVVLIHFLYYADKVVGIGTVRSVPCGPCVRLRLARDFSEAAIHVSRWLLAKCFHYCVCDSPHKTLLPGASSVFFIFLQLVREKKEVAQRRNPLQRGL